jgi:phage baseplate assembly protein gpV
MLKSLIDIKSRSYSGHIFKGTVVANNDPNKLELIKVEVKGLYEGNVELMPWAFSIRRMFMGSKAGQGEFGVPSLGTEVGIILQDGDPHYPMYLGSILQDGAQVSEAATNYPHRYGWKDGAGNVFFIDQATGQFRFQHLSGAVINIANDGTITISSPSGMALSATGNITISAGGDCDLTGSGRVLLP